jgi:hypothetical protein
MGGTNVKMNYRHGASWLFDQFIKKMIYGNDKILKLSSVTDGGAKEFPP